MILVICFVSSDIRNIYIPWLHCIAPYVTQADALPLNEVGILKAVKNY